MFRNNADRVVSQKQGIPAPKHGFPELTGFRPVAREKCEEDRDSGIITSFWRDVYADHISKQGLPE